MSNLNGLTLEKSSAIVDAAMSHRAERHWYIKGTRERAIETIRGTVTKTAAFEALLSVLTDGEVEWLYDDPCDPCESDRWFYWHPAMVM